MNINEHTTPDKLERYSFIWSEVRLVVAAVALFLGGIPPILIINPVPALFGPILSLLKLAWIVSGIAAVYLIYRWNKGRAIFGDSGEMRRVDNSAFLVMVISGLNLGLTGLLGSNPGMSISSNRVVLFIVAVAYLWAAQHLYKRWKEKGKRVF